MIRTITTPAGKVYHPGHTYRTEDGRRVFVYWSVRNGKLYGPVRHAVEGSGVVFAAIAAAIEEAHAEALEMDAARRAGWVCMGCGLRFANIGDHDTETCAHDAEEARRAAREQNRAAYASHRFCSHERFSRAMIECDHAEALEDEAVREAAKARHADCPWCKAPHGPSEAEREAALRASLDVDAAARIERAEAALIEAAEEAHAAERERLHSEQLDQAERERPGLLSPGLLDEAEAILDAATVYVRHYPARRYRHMGAGI